MVTTLVDRRKFMLVCDTWMDEAPWSDVAYELYEKGLTRFQVHQLQTAYVFPRPRFNDLDEWKKYPPVNVDMLAVTTFKKIVGIEHSLRPD